MRKIVGTLLAALLIILIGAPVPAAAAPRQAPRPGAPGIGDPYFPTDGNGGYDVAHYDLDLAYEPATDRLRGRATISARATQALSWFNLDLNGLQVTDVRVDGRPARWRHVGDELTIIPQRAIAKRSRFRVVVRYGGVPLVLDEPALGQAGVFPTDDGALIVGQPHVADTWFPVNDHPLDKASYRFEVTVPRGLEVVANGYLADVEQTPAHGDVDLGRPGPDGLLSGHRHDRAVQPRLPTRRRHPLLGCHRPGPLRPARTAYRGALRHHGGDDSAYKRLSRVIDVPAGGGELSFYVTRDTEPEWDFFFVEARPVGTDDWTTLPDLNGHTSQDTGASCPGWLALHPFLAHYQTADGDDCVHTERNQRGLARGERSQRRLRAVAARPVGTTPASR